MAGCSFRPHLVLLLIATLLGPFADSGHAQITDEVWRWEATPLREDVDRWLQVSGKRHYHFKLTQFDSETAKELSRLTPSARSFRLEFEILPDDDETYAALRRLSEVGIPLDFVGNFGALPTHPRWDDLLSSGFRSYRIMLDHFPFPFEAGILNGFPAETLTVVFHTRAYPKFVELEWITALAPRISLEFHQDYWPLYPQVDVMKLIPNPKIVHVRDMVPEEPTFSYLKTMMSLREIVADALFFPSETSFWDQFGKMPTRWMQRDRLFDDQALKAFEDSRQQGARRVLVDREEALTPQERLRYQRSPLEVEIRQQAP